MLKLKLNMDPNLNELTQRLAALPPDGTPVFMERSDFVANQRKALKEMIATKLRARKAVESYT